jgi:hypothetical protein
MLTLKNICIEDRPWVSELMRMSGFEQRICVFKPVQLVEGVCRNHWTRGGIFDCASANRAPYYLYPAGRGDVTVALEAMAQDAKDNGVPFRMSNVTPESMAFLECRWPGRFDFVPQRESFDYIYLRESLATLAGKKLHGKRNHIARFR